ncbi:MAG: DUF2085 domain-containing protein [archaeon]|nr:DUF2085 domain-containing protein [archaeon]
MRTEDERLYGRIFVAIGIAFAAFLVLSVALPFMNTAGLLTHLDGRVNVIDHAGLWSGLDPLTSLVYTIGDFGCHQEQTRTILLNDNEMPFCIRETFLLVGIVSGFLAIALSKRMRSMSTRNLFVIGAVLVLLTLAEWTFENQTSIDIPQIRAVVSVLSGIGVPLVLRALLVWETGLLDRRSA